MKTRRQLRGGALDGLEVSFSNPEIAVWLRIRGVELIAHYRWDQEDDRYLYIKTTERPYAPKSKGIANLDCEERRYGMLVDVNGFRLELTRWVVVESAS